MSTTSRAAAGFFVGSALLLGVSAAAAGDRPAFTIGSKRFTESLVLGEIGKAIAGRAGEAEVKHKEGLGGTAIVFRALQEGSIDLYAEYTGTIAEAILKDPSVTDLEAMRRALAGLGLGMSEPLGFENTYALATTRRRARELDLKKISDLAAHPEVALGLSHEFLGRSDGWPGLAERYGLGGMKHVGGMDHGLSYEAVASGSIAILDIYSTDAKIERYDLVTLVDDRRFFPSYKAVWLYRAELPARLPATFARLSAVAGRIDERAMIAMNARVELAGEQPADTAARFVDELQQVTRAAPPEVIQRGFWAGMLEAIRSEGPAHLMLVGISLLASMVVGVPLGVAAAKLRRAGGPILAATGVVQTIPALALLCFFIPLLGIGKLPALAALFLYGLLPIVRNTATGLRSIPQTLIESAEALGLPRFERLLRIELPLASRTVLAGIKTSAVINVGTATVAAFVGAGGLGSPISTGLNLNDTSRILQGAVPAAALALLVQGAFALLERAIVPRGLVAFEQQQEGGERQPG